MSPAHGLLLGMIALLWLCVLRFFRLRNWRAAGLAGVATALMLVALLLPWPLAGLIQATLWTVVLLIFFTKSEWVEVISEAEYRYLEDYVGVLHQIRRLKPLEMDPATYLFRFQQCIRMLEALEVPREWRQIHNATVKELHGRATRMVLLAKPSPEEKLVLDARWSEVEASFEHLVRTRAGFWTGWPMVSRQTRT